jgi:hypothetical protein
VCCRYCAERAALVSQTNLTVLREKNQKIPVFCISNHALLNFLKNKAVLPIAFYEYEVDFAFIEGTETLGLDTMYSTTKHFKVNLLYSVLNFFYCDVFDSFGILEYCICLL